MLRTFLERLGLAKLPPMPVPVVIPPPPQKPPVEVKKPEPVIIVEEPKKESTTTSFSTPTTSSKSLIELLLELTKNQKVLVKSSVCFKYITNTHLIIICAVKECWSNRKNEPVVTSAFDGKHMPNSRHYVGEALDVRTSTLKPQEVTEFANSLKNYLGKSFDVVVEADHIHIEYDPK